MGALNQQKRDRGIAVYRTLIAIRNGTDQHASPQKVVAVIADPVFSRDDDRLANVALSPAVASAASDQNANEPARKVLEHLKRDGARERLIHAGEEADAILAAAPRGTALVDAVSMRRRKPS